MIPKHPSDLFVRAIHRRMALLRGLERVGLCVLGGCALLLALMPIRIWRGEPTGILLSGVMGASLFAGLLWAVIARPTRLIAAVTADRQLRLSDLLSTALTLQRSDVVDDFERTVLALADARCLATSPSAVLLNRLGARSWGGIALAVALVAGIHLMAGDDAQSQARAAGTPRSWQEIESARENANPFAGAGGHAPDLRRAKPGGGTDDPDPLNSAVSDSGQTTAAAASNTARNGAGGAQQGTAGAGAGQSVSRGGAGAAMTSTGGGNHSGSAPGGEVAGAGGGGTSESTAGDRGAKTGATAGDPANATRRPAPVWRSDTWPADVDAARAAVQTGRVPDTYRDLVRSYFERP
ncbi:MAG TPA: hypothetical protein VH475_21815 [Tepidisphaeraceae bacterium]|jgi:hypothetical protein